jgi:hypothetical protein
MWLYDDRPTGGQLERLGGKWEQFSSGTCKGKSGNSGGKDRQQLVAIRLSELITSISASTADVAASAFDLLCEQSNLDAVRVLRGFGCIYLRRAGSSIPLAPVDLSTSGLRTSYLRRLRCFHASPGTMYRILQQSAVIAQHAVTIMQRTAGPLIISPCNSQVRAGWHRAAGEPAEFPASVTASARRFSTTARSPTTRPSLPRPPSGS